MNTTNKKEYCFIGLLLCFFNIEAIAVEYKLPYPEGTSHAITQCGSAYGQPNPFSHTGKMKYAWDFGMTQGQDIVAVADGVVTHVVQSYGQGYCDKNLVNKGNRVVIKHSDGLSSLYLHLLKNSATVNIGDSIKQGQIIGKSGASGYVCSSYGGDGAHLHFQLQDSCGSWWCQSRNISFSEINSCKKVTVASTNSASSTPSENNTVKGIFDGAGSLVSPNEVCWGCNKDEAKMHPHGVGSTVAFQWLYDANSCSHIDLTADKEIEVVVKAKKWKEHFTQKAFKVKIGKNPITLTRPDSSSDWTTLAITSTDPINQPTSIYAYCKNSNDSIYDNNNIDVDKDLVDVTYDHFWTGTGSIITVAEARPFGEAGIGYDYAATFKSKNSLTSFQWYTNSNCQSLKIKGYDESSSAINGIDIKGWADNSWINTGCGSSLPCTITAPSIGNYYILKVKSSPDAIKSGYLEASCI